MIYEIVNKIKYFPFEVIYVSYEKKYHFIKIDIVPLTAFYFLSFSYNRLTDSF